MWIRKCDVDAKVEAPMPVPTQIASNEEFIPPPQTPDQYAWEKRIEEMATKAAKKLGMSRRSFLRSSGGMAVAMLAYNETYGKTYDVDPVEAFEPAACQGFFPCPKIRDFKDSLDFIFYPPN